jgi:hypothetical protein
MSTSEITAEMEFAPEAENGYEVQSSRKDESTINMNRADAPMRTTGANLPKFVALQDNMSLDFDDGTVSTEPTTEFTNLTSYGSPADDLLLGKIIVLEGEPFYWVGSENKNTQPMQKLNHGLARRVLSASVEKASNNRVEMEFNKLSMESLVEAFQSRAAFLHLSCHSNGEYLALEDDLGIGRMNPLPAERLGKFLKRAKHTIRLVFLSAPCSQRVGQCLLEAGVEHVVCSSTDVLDTTAIRFAKIFWATLARGEDTIQCAFDYACSTCDLEGYPDAHNFVLIPANGPHDIKIQLPEVHQESDGRAGIAAFKTALPPRPVSLVGRHNEVRKIIDAVTNKHVDFIAVTGPPEVGKHTIVSEACHYIEDRRNFDAVNINPVQWFTLNHSIDLGNAFHKPIKFLFRVTREAIMTEEDLHLRSDWICHEINKQISLHFKSETKTMMVFELINMEGQAHADRISIVLGEVLRWCHCVLVLVIHDEFVKILPRVTASLPCLIRITPLDYEQSLNLFESCISDQFNCDIDMSVSTLCDFLYGDKIVEALKGQHTTPITERAWQLFAMIGSGYPKAICETASSMTGDFCHSLVNLRKEIANLEKEIAKLDGKVGNSKQASTGSKYKCLDSQDAQGSPNSGENQDDGIVSQFNLGLMYGRGNGVAPDYMKAAKHLKAAADQGHIKAQHILGVMCKFGHGLAKDEQQAVKYLKLAADQGHVPSQHFLGTMLKDGDGVVQDFKEAVKYLKLAADQGHAHSQHVLGSSLNNGDPIVQDNEETVKYLTRATDQRHHFHGKVTIGHSSVHVFEARPLIWRSKEKIHPLPVAGLEKQRAISEHHASFHVFTSDSLRDVLCSATAQVLHLVCGGNSDYLGIEDTNKIASMRPFTKADVLQWFALNTGNLSIVFAPSFVADTLILADVPHILSFPPAAVSSGSYCTFVKAFYQRFMEEQPLLVAFEFGKQVVHNKHGKKEAEAFELLPVGGNHGVFAILQKDTLGNNAREQVNLFRSGNVKSSIFHPDKTPECIPGYQLVQYDLIQSIMSKQSKVVAVTGLQGAGKTELVMVSCQYLYDRNHFDSLRWDEIAWFDYKQHEDFANTHPMAKAFVALFDAIGDNQLSETQFWDDDRTGENIGAISAHFHEKKALVVLNFEDLEYENDSGARKAVLLIHELTPKLNSMKIVLIYHDHIYLDLSKVAYTTIS